MTFGLQPHRLDLHVHTPASKCYNNPKTDSHTAKDLITAALGKGLSGIAVTDHNTAAWIEIMKVAANEIVIDGRKLVIFPGVEISTHEGYHIVVIFDPSASQALVENFLGAIGISSQQYGKSDELCEKGIFDILDIVRKRESVAILAHIDSIKGAFSEMTSIDDEGKISVPNTCRSLFNDDRYDAVEVVSSKLPNGFDITHGITRVPPFYQASDNPDPADLIHHHFEGIGTRSSFFMLDELSLEGLRQCFADPDVRIRFNDQTDVNKIWPHVVRMSVGNSGFLAYQNFPFHSGLNCVIGGKGVGKSLVIEFLRFGLGQPSLNEELNKDHIDKLQKRLGPLNTVEIEFTVANGVTYIIKRYLDGAVVCTNKNTNEEYLGDITELFPILAYSQTEVIKIAEKEEAQLRLVDALIKSQNYKKSIEEIQQSLTENDRLVADALAARVKLEDARLDVATVQESIANIDRVLSSGLLSEMRKSEAKKSQLETELDFVNDLSNLVDSQIENIQNLDIPSISDEDRRDSDLAEQEKFRLEAVQTIITGMENIKNSIVSLIERSQGVLANWIPSFTEQLQRYESELQGTDQAKLETDRRSNVDKLGIAQRKVDKYRKVVEEDLPSLLSLRSTLLDKLDASYTSHFQLRDTKFNQLTTASNGKLRLSLVHSANLDSYKQAFRHLLRGSGPTSISTVIRDKITDSISTRNLGEIIINRNIEVLASRASLTLEVAERVLDKLWNLDEFSDVLAIQHSFYPDDVPTIQFNKGEEQFAELSELSIGQKCTALLIIALCDGIMPVIIDQPEDALDIASVWEDIAKKLRFGKYGRQFILTTHNSSLAVGSDTDNFLVLTPLSGDRAKVKCKGAIDRKDVRREVIDHLEGGDEPYLLKHKKYHIQNKG